MFNISKQQLIDIFNFRAACRSYDSTRKIAKEDMDCILQLARLSPSSVGSEPWKFIVLQNPTIRAKIAPVAWGIKHPIQEASHIVVALAKKGARYDSEFFRQSLAKRGLTPEQMEKTIECYHSFQRHDINILENDRTLFDWCSKQTYIALGNMMTGAAMLGIDSCPVEGFNYAEVNRILAEEGLFDPQEYAVSYMITFGYRAKDITKKYRKPTEEVIQWVE